MIQGTPSGMGVSSVALNERGGDNEEDIEPEDESDS